MISTVVLSILEAVPSPPGLSEPRLKMGISIGLSLVMPKISWVSIVPSGGGFVGPGVGVGVGVGSIMSGSKVRLLGEPVLQGSSDIHLVTSLSALEGLLLQVSVSCVGLGGVGYASPVVLMPIGGIESYYGVIYGDMEVGLSSAGVVSSGGGRGVIVNKIVMGVLCLLRAGIVISSPVSLVSASPPVCAPAPVPVAGLPLTAVVI